MRLTDHTDYSLRVLMYLNQKRTLATLNELSERLRISKNNLIKVSNQLAKFGFIETTRGRAGGLVIREETGQKTLKEIISKTEETFFIASCFAGGDCSCIFLRSCHLQKSLREALQAFLNSLNQKTLNDVTPKSARGM
jgi:Rrf2 family nitric oxide-sensitive transcriptional repressor